MIHGTLRDTSPKIFLFETTSAHGCSLVYYYFSFLSQFYFNIK